MAEDPVQSELNLAETEIARFGNDAVSVYELMQFLRHSFNWWIMEGLFEKALVQRAIQEHEIQASEEELDEFVNSFRASRGLLTASETEKWLAEKNLVIEDMYELCEYELKKNKLKKKLFDDDIVRARFVLSAAEFEAVEYYQIVINKENKAREIAALIHEGKSFFELARQHSRDENSRKLCGYAGIQARASLRPELESRIYSAEPGDVVGPVKSLGDFHILLVEQFIPAELSQSTQEKIRDDLFSAWKKELLETENLQVNC